MMGHFITYTDMLQGIIQPSCSHHMPEELSCISLSSKFCSDLVMCKTVFFYFKIAPSVEVFTQLCNPLNISKSPHSKENLTETCVRRVDYKGSLMLFTKDKASVINVGKLSECCLKELEMKQLSLQAQEYDINQTD